MSSIINQNDQSSQPSATPTQTSLSKKVLDTLVASVGGFLDDNCLVLAGAVAFSAIQSIFPLILGFLAISSLFLQDPSSQENFIRGVYRVFPELLSLNIDFNALLKGWVEGAGLASIFSLLALLWAASGVFGQLKFAINTAFHVQRDQRNPVKQIGLQLLLLVILGGLLLIAFGINIIAGLIFNAKVSLFGVSPYDFNFMLPILSYIIPMFLELVVFALLFKISPARRGVRWKPVWLAAVVTVLLFELLKYLFGLYVSIFGASNNAAKTYGAIGGVFVFLFFLFLAAAVILFGAELAATMHNFRSGLGAAQTKDAVVETPTEQIGNELVPPQAARKLKEAGAAAAAVATGEINTKNGAGKTKPVENSLKAEPQAGPDKLKTKSVIRLESAEPQAVTSSSSSNQTLTTFIGGVVLGLAAIISLLFNRKSKQ